MVSISARRAEDLGSIPGRGVYAPTLRPGMRLGHPSPGACGCMRAKQLEGANACAGQRCSPAERRRSPPQIFWPSLSYQIRGSIVVSISARHAEDPGSIPGRGAFALRSHACLRLPSLLPSHPMRAMLRPSSRVATKHAVRLIRSLDRKQQPKTHSESPAFNSVVV